MVFFPLLVLGWLVVFHFVWLGRRIKRWLGGELSFKEQVEMLANIKNREIRKRKLGLKKDQERLGILQKFSDEILAELKSYLEEISQMAGFEFEKNIAIQRERLAKLEGIHKDIVTACGKIGGALKEIEQGEKNLDLRLRGHALNLRLLDYLKKLGAKPDLVNIDTEANRAASLEVVKSLSQTLSEAEVVVDTSLGASPEEAVRAMLSREGLEPVTESTEEVFRQAKKILAPQ